MVTETAPAKSSLEIYHYPRSCPRSKNFRVQVNGQAVFVHATGVADFAAVTCAGPIEIQIEIDVPVATAVVRPSRRKLAPVIEGKAIRLTLPGPQCVQIEINGLPPLHFYANPPETNRPVAGTPGVHYFAAGQTYEVGRLQLRDNETLYIEAGAIVKGQIFAQRARNIRICGRGVLDGSYYQHDTKVRSILLDRCQDVVVEDIIMIEPTMWMLVFGACRDVRVSNLKQIGQVVSSDGIDVVGCQNVLIENCFLKNNDDCVVIKSFTATEHNGDKYDWAEDVDNVVIRNCVLMNDGAGNAMEIGHELRCASIGHITFRDIDVLHVHGMGAVFSIHNSDRARIHDILWENIHVEHCYDCFIDFRAFKSMWSGDEERGTFDTIRLRNVRWTRSIYNPGYTTSVIGGWDEKHMARDVVLEDIYFDDRKVTSQSELELFTKCLTGLEIK